MCNREAIVCAECYWGGDDSPRPRRCVQPGTNEYDSIHTRSLDIINVVAGVLVVSYMQTMQ